MRFSRSKPLNKNPIVVLLFLVLLCLLLYFLFQLIGLTSIFTILGSISVISVLLVLIGGYRYKWSWTGLHQKTLWDWMQLLIIPIMIAIGGFVFNQVQSENEQKRTEERAVVDRDIATDNQREEALQSYYDKMSDLLLTENLRTSGDAEARNIARTRTLSTLRKLDGERKGQLLQFLYESQLINSPSPIINLMGANLQGAILADVDLEGAFLQGVEFQGAYLENANLAHTNLQGANLEGAHLLLANLTSADLGRLIVASPSQYSERCTSLREADLRHAFLRKANLEGICSEGVNLEDATLGQANLRGASLQRANLRGADLKEVDLSDARIEGANLLNASLEGAHITQEQLNQVQVQTTAEPSQRNVP